LYQIQRPSQDAPLEVLLAAEARMMHLQAQAYKAIGEQIAISNKMYRNAVVTEFLEMSEYVAHAPATAAAVVAAPAAPAALAALMAFAAARGPAAAAAFAWTGGGPASAASGSAIGGAIAIAFAFAIAIATAGSARPAAAAPFANGPRELRFRGVGSNWALGCTSTPSLRSTTLLHESVHVYIHIYIYIHIYMYVRAVL